MKKNVLTIAVVVFTLASIPTIQARGTRDGTGGHSSTQPKSTHHQSAAGDRPGHKNSAARVKAQKKGKNSTQTKSKRNKPPAATPEFIEEQKVELPTRDDADDLDENGPALMPDEPGEGGM